MSRFTKEAGPCNCGCHDIPGTAHLTACCAYTHQPRKQAEAEARMINEGATIEKIPGTDDEWEPGGRLGNDERYAVPVLRDPDIEREIEEALGNHCPRCNRPEE